MALATSISYQVEAQEDLWTTIEEIVYYYDLYSRSMNDEAYTMFIRHFNRFLEAVKPSLRMPEIIELIGENVVLSPWEAGIPSEYMRSTLVDLVHLKNSGARFDEVKQRLKEFINALLYDPVSIEELAKTPEELITLTLILLVVSTNPY